VLVWRRSYDIPPPELDEDSVHYPGNDRRYKDVDKVCVCESLLLACIQILSALLLVCIVVNFAVAYAITYYILLDGTIIQEQSFGDTTLWMSMW
jgi:hypothetical protein